ncbi:hypothetical protein ILUMI_12901 [Ignelater luminosus]|uniref:trypsin n=1 Tax=Ignelater luminosus TaxID=2038154 RepID=A0A8K0CT90_IGNLU|nr:hypothetical protein ILUMI_12901 [Ignelater luminosus]
MRYFYLPLLLKLVLIDAFIVGRMKLTEVNNLTKELNLYNHNELLPWKNPTSKLTHYTASLLPSHKNSRIIGGRAVHIQKHPFTAYLALKGSRFFDFRGGAVIVARNWAISAAHCLEYIKSDDIKKNKAFVCSNTSYWQKDYKQHQITRKYIHEKYDADELDYDIGLLRVNQPFDGKFEKPIKWVGNNYKYIPNTNAYVLGWGSTDPSDFKVVTQLREAQIKLEDFNKCSKRYEEKNYLLTDRMICAGEEGKDACVYDSGGPLIQNGALIGIVSWGTDVCADKHLPGVYSKISMFSQWLQSKMGIKSRAMRRMSFNASQLNMS